MVLGGWDWVSSAVAEGCGEGEEGSGVRRFAAAWRAAGRERAMWAGRMGVNAGRVVEA